jgi:hypothetical protein
MCAQPGCNEGRRRCPLTIGDIRDAIHGLDNDVEIYFGNTIDGIPLLFGRFKWRGEKLLQIELQEGE